MESWPPPQPAQPQPVDRWSDSTVQMLAVALGVVVAVFLVLFVVGAFI